MDTRMHKILLLPALHTSKFADNTSFSCCSRPDHAYSKMVTILPAMINDLILVQKYWFYVIQSITQVLSVSPCTTRYQRSYIRKHCLLCNTTTQQLNPVHLQYVLIQECTYLHRSEWRILATAQPQIYSRAGDFIHCLCRDWHCWESDRHHQNEKVANKAVGK